MKSETNVDAINPEHVLGLWRLIEHDSVCQAEEYVKYVNDPDVRVADYEVRIWNYAVEDFLACKEFFRPIIIAEDNMRDSEEVDIETFTEMVKDVYRMMPSEAKLVMLKVLINADRPVSTARDGLTPPPDVEGEAENGLCLNLDLDGVKREQSRGPSSRTGLKSE